MTSAPQHTVSLCLACGHPTDATATTPGQDWRCDCEPEVAAWRQAQERERYEPWNLCVLCARDYAPLRSRWAWLACPACLDVNRSIGEQFGKDLALPLGRHSIMNGCCISLGDLDEERLRDRLGAMVQLVHNWQSIDRWREAEFARVVAGLPEEVRQLGRLPVRDYPGLAGPGAQRSEDAWLRCRGVRTVQQLADIRAAVDEITDSRD